MHHAFDYFASFSSQCTKDNGKLIYCKNRVFVRFSLNQLTSRNMCFRCHRVSCGDNHEISGVSGHEYDNRRVEEVVKDQIQDTGAVLCDPFSDRKYIRISRLREGN